MQVVSSIKRTPSGVKYKTLQGFAAIKDGIKIKQLQAKQPPAALQARKPAWLKVRLPTGEGFTQTRKIVSQHRLATVCEESHCPNIAECWGKGTATIMLMGSVCTRACRFCAVDTGNPNGWLDAEEPENAAKSVELMNLSYIVLTSVDRDDLADFGAAHFAKTISAIKARCPHVNVEALTPDFNGNVEAIKQVVQSGLSVFAQNIETVKRLTHLVRDPRAGYEQTMLVLEKAKQLGADRNILTKSSLLLGLGETDAEIVSTMKDLRSVGCDILTLGQYLRPTKQHLPLKRWVTPEQFNQYRTAGLSLGFMEVASGPLVRSSYRADRVLEGNNLGLQSASQKASQISLLKMPV